MQPLWLVEECLTVLITLMSLAWDQALQWGKKGKTRGQIGEISASEASQAVSWGGGKGGGAWRHAFDAAVPWYQILVSCSDWSNVFMLTDWGDVDSIALFQYHAPTIREKIFKTRILSKQYKFHCKTFRLSFGPKKSKKYACDLLRKEKEAFKIWSFSYTLPW